MNKQDGLNRIEWTDYTWNPIGGCLHDCKWDMPDGSTAQCYAKTIAESAWVSGHYHKGFEHHYWNPERLHEPLKLRNPAKIFLDSMSDLIGHWVADEQIQRVLDVCAESKWHTYQLLTKNAPRLLKFDFPPNVWVGVSVPPTWYMGKLMKRHQQLAMLHKTLDVLSQIEARVTWMSIEPLSWDIAADMHIQLLDWIVIGAASNGRKVYQPEPQWITNLLTLMDERAIPVFFKGNLRGNSAASVWREDFPGAKAVHAAPVVTDMPAQMALF